MPMINEAIFCVMEGVATPEAIDTVMKLGMAHPMGPLRSRTSSVSTSASRSSRCSTGGWATTSTGPPAAEADGGGGRSGTENGPWVLPATSVTSAERHAAPDSRPPTETDGHPRLDACAWSRAGAAVARSQLRLLRHHRHSRHHARPGAGRHPLLAVCLHRGGDHRRAAPGARHDLQVRRGRPQPRRRQVGDHRRQQAAATARCCSARTAASSRRWAAGTSRRRTSAPARGHGVHPAGDRSRRRPPRPDRAIRRR